MIDLSYTPRVRDLSLALAAPVAHHPDEQRAIISLCAKQDQDALQRQSEDPEWLVLEALLNAFRNQPLKPVFRVGEVAAILRQNGNGNGFTAKRVGSILRNFGFTHHRDNKGFAIINDPSFKTRLVERAIALGIMSAQ